MSVGSGRVGRCLFETSLAIFDTFMCLFVMFPLAVFHWRGTWNLMDVYVFPDSEFISSWITLTVGSVAGVICYLLQPTIDRSLEGVHWVQRAFGTRLYLYIYGWIILCYWRGLWNLVDHYLSYGWRNSLVCYILFQAVSLAARTCRTNAGLPVQIQLDTDPEVITPDTRFRVKQSEKPCQYFLDTLFTQFVVVTSNVLVWRGIWNILDAFLFPRNHLVSDVASLAFGYLVLLLFFFLEYPISIGSFQLDKYPRIYKIIYEDVIFIIVTWGVLLVWRGGWDLVLEHVVPDLLVGGWVCHLIGSLGLMMLQGFSNVGTNGIDLDGMYTKGEGVFPTKYLRTFLEDQLKPKAKYHKVEMQTLIASDEEDDEEESSSGIPDKDVPSENDEYYADSEDSDSGIKLQEDHAPLIANGKAKQKSVKTRLEKYKDPVIPQVKLLKESQKSNLDGSQEPLLSEISLDEEPVSYEVVGDQQPLLQEVTENHAGEKKEIGSIFL